MKGFRGRTTLLQKYIVSYLLVFLVPFLAMSTIIYYNSVATLREEIEQSNINRLKQVENLASERMSELEMIAARIAYDQRLTPYMMSHGYYGREAINELKKYKANSSIIEELLVHYHDQETIFSTNGSYSPSSFQKKYLLNDIESQEVFSELQSVEPFLGKVKTIVTNNGNSGNMIAYSFPISPTSSTPYGTVMYLVNESTMKDMIRNISGRLDGNVYIMDEHRNVFASEVNDESISEDQLQHLSGQSEGVDNVKVNGKDYSVVSVKSDLNNWEFLMLTDADQFFRQLDNMKILITAILLIIFIIGMALAVTLGRKQYEPVESLLEMTRRNRKKALFQEEEGNVWESIRNTISDIFEDHQTLNDEMYRHRPFARDQFFIRLLKGDIRDEAEIGSMLSSLNLTMGGGPCFVAILYFEEGVIAEKNMKDREGIQRLLSGLCLEKAVLYGVDLLYNDAMALVVSMEHEDSTDMLAHRKSLVAELQLIIRESSPFDPTIGVGGLYREKNKINSSYIEAMATRDYKLASPQGSIIYFEDLSTVQEEALGYPAEDQLKLIQSMKQGDKVVAAEALQKMFTELESKDLSIQVMKCICFDIINTVLKTLSEMGLRHALKDLGSIVDFTSIDKLHGHLHLLVISACEENEKRKESHNVKLRNEILDYIGNNYKEYDLSLESIALKFKLSVSYLSRFIKEQTGDTFTQYIQDLRMRDVKNRLKMTDIPIKEIVMDVGYKDVANFTRKFKKIVGVTPGQYRNLSR